MSDKESLEFEARYYLAESRRLSQDAMEIFKTADDLLEKAVETWARAKEVAG
jgi:hypothetical protein